MSAPTIVATGSVTSANSAGISKEYVNLETLTFTDPANPSPGSENWELIDAPPGQTSTVQNPTTSTPTLVLDSDFGTFRIRHTADGDVGELVFAVLTTGLIAERIPGYLEQDDARAISTEGTWNKSSNIQGWFPSMHALLKNTIDALHTASERHYSPGSIDGLLAAYSTITTITIAVGSARDSTDTVNMDVGSPLAATISNSGANGLDTGSEASNTWYAIYVISKVDGTDAALLSASFTSPTMPSGYTYFRRVGAVKNNSVSNFSKFYYRGSGKTRRVWLNNFSGDFTIALSNGRSATETVVDCSNAVAPTGTEITFYYGYINDSTVSKYFEIKINGGSTEMFLFRPGTTSTQSRIGSTGFIPCDSEQKIEYNISTAGSATHELDLWVMGWTDEL